MVSPQKQQFEGELLLKLFDFVAIVTNGLFILVYTVTLEGVHQCSWFFLELLLGSGRVSSETLPEKRL